MGKGDVPHSLKPVFWTDWCPFSLTLAQLRSQRPERGFTYPAGGPNVFLIYVEFFSNIRALCDKFAVSTWCTQYCFLLFRRRRHHERNKISPCLMTWWRLNQGSLCVSISKKLFTCNLLHAAGFLCVSPALRFKAKSQRRVTLLPLRCFPWKKWWQVISARNVIGRIYCSSMWTHKSPPLPP
jgi:hypothetical protein